jgi:hypothetical protein
MTEEFTKTYAPWVALLSLIVTVALTGISYQQSLTRDSVARVFDFAKDYREKLASTDDDFVTDWNSYAAANITPIRNDRSLTAQQMDDRQTQTTLKFFSENSDREKKFESLVAFYDGLSQCTEIGLCDCRAAKSMFIDGVVKLRNALYPKLVDIWANEGRDIGHPMDQFIDFTAKKSCSS